MAKFHDIYKFVFDGFTPDESSIQRDHNDFGSYYEVLLQMTLEMTVKKGFTKFNHIAIDRTIKKSYNSNQNMINKKECNLLVKYYLCLEINLKKLKKLDKPARKY